MMELFAAIAGGCGEWQHRAYENHVTPFNLKAIIASSWSSSTGIRRSKAHFKSTQQAAFSLCKALVMLLYVIKLSEFQSLFGVRQVQVEEETTKAKAIFRFFHRKLAYAGFEDRRRRRCHPRRPHGRRSHNKTHRRERGHRDPRPIGSLIDAKETQDHSSCLWQLLGAPEADLQCPSPSYLASFRSRKLRLWPEV